MATLAKLRTAIIASRGSSEGKPQGEAHRSKRMWLGLAIAFNLCFSLLFLQQAFSIENLIQDDARQHVFWMQRFADPALFPNDLIADYFQSVAPAGYSLLYRGVGALGIDPLLFNKFLPIGLGLITTVYCFGLALAILPVPAAAFASSLLMSQSLCFTDTMVSGIQKSFIYPLLFAFLYYLARRRLWPTAMTVALLGWFYPQMVLVAAGTLALQLVGWRTRRSGQTNVGGQGSGGLGFGGFGWVRDRQTWRISLLGLAAGFAVLLPYALESSAYGPVVTEAQARQMPEFLRGGRARYFRDDDPWKFWLEGRSGLRFASVLTPVTNVLGLLLPLLTRWGRHFPLVKQLQPCSGIVPRFLLASGGLFLAAHGLIFRLHLPSRYSGHTLRVALTLTSGIALVILLDGALGWAQNHTLSPAPIRGLASLKRVLGLGLAGLLSASLLLYPLWVKDFPIPTYHQAYNEELFAFFRAQPKDSLIASLSQQADDLPSMAGRSVLVAAEYAIPYHLGYYEQFRQRVADLIEAQYSSDPAVVRSFIERYGVDFWLIDLEAYWSDYFEENAWLYQYQPAAQQAEARLQSSQKTALETVRRSCQVINALGSEVLGADCILNRLKPDAANGNGEQTGRG